MKPTRVRTIALKIVLASLEEGRWANRMLVPNLFQLEDPRDQKLLTEIVYGTIKMRLRLDWTINRFLMKRTIDELTPYIRNILRISAYQLLFTRIPPYAAISEGVKLARRFGHRGTAALVNAVLRRISENRPVPSEPWILHSHPKWMFLRWKELWGEEMAVKIMMHNNTPAPIYIRINTLKIGVHDVLRILSDKNVDFQKEYFPPEAVRIARAPQLIGLSKGLYYVQDKSSQTVAYLMSHEPDWLVYDFAAAPGGKISHIAALMGDGGRIIAVEIHRSRAEEMEKVMARLGVKSVKVVVGNSGKIRFDELADAVLADVPCSGLGTLRRRAELRWRMRPDRIPELARIQRSILENAARHVKVGGVIIYTTCTIEPRENNIQIEEFLNEHRNFELVPAEKYIPREFTKGPYMMIDGAEHDCDYMFGARLRRVS